MNGGGGGSIEQMNINYAVGHGTTVEGQITLKTKVNTFGFHKTFCSIEGNYI